MPEQPPKDPVDPKSFLLPKKEAGPSPLSAQRVNAGALFEQELNAAAELPEKKSGPTQTEDPRTFSPAVPTMPVPVPPSPKKDESAVRAVETYTTDINRVMEGGAVSSVTIAAAEAERRSKATKGEAIAPAGLSEQEKTSRWRWVLIIGGVLLILAALGAVAAILLRAAPQAAPAADVAAPFISVDQIIPIAAASGTTRDMLMPQLEAAREQVSLAVGLVAELNVGTATTSSNALEPMPAQQFLSTLVPDIPPDLLLTVQPAYLLGVHSYDENQAFLVLSVDSYQQAYSDMLAWEPAMQADLSPLFTRHPSPSLPGGTTDASSTAATSSPQFLQTGFVDQVVDNHDARVILDSSGNILLLWTFLDRNTVVITTNEYTLLEIIRRVNTSSVVPQP